MWKIAGGIVLAAVILFVGSAIVAGVMESEQRNADRKKVESLSSSLSLLQRINSGIAQKKLAKKKVPEPACWYLAAAAYRLAEARDMKLSIEVATAATDVPDLMDYIRGAGFPDTRNVVRGLAVDVYKENSLSPDGTFNERVERCASGGRR